MTFTLQLMSAIAMVLSIVGNILVNKKKWIGFVVWMISNITWIAVNLMSVEINWVQTALFAVFTVLNVHGIINWRKIMSSKTDGGGHNET